MSSLLREFKTSDQKSEEPVVKVGAYTSSVAGILALLAYLAPNLISEKTTTIILVIAAFVLPIVTALLTRGRVWSPASVKILVDESIRDATIELKDRLETQREVSKLKYENEDPLAP